MTKNKLNQFDSKTWHFGQKTRFIADIQSFLIEKPRLSVVSQLLIGNLAYLSKNLIYRRYSKISIDKSGLNLVYK